MLLNIYSAIRMIEHMTRYQCRVYDKTQQFILGTSPILCALTSTASLLLVGLEEPVELLILSIVFLSVIQLYILERRKECYNTYPFIYRAVTTRLQIPHAEELLHSDSKKKKFLVECESLEPSAERPWPRFRDFQVKKGVKTVNRICTKLGNPHPAPNQVPRLPKVGRGT